MSLISALFGVFVLQSYVKVPDGYHIDFDRDPPNDVARAGFVLRVTELLLQAARREGWGVQPLGELLRCQ